MPGRLINQQRFNDIGEGPRETPRGQPARLPNYGT
jgi:hypothetical protein